MPDIIRIKINVKQIDKSRLYVGEKGTYLDATLIPKSDGVDEYGCSHLITQDVSKADREAGIKGPIIGNAKTVVRKSEQSAPAPRTAPDAEQLPGGGNGAGDDPFA